MTSKTFKSSRPTGTMLRVDSTEVFSEAHLTIVLHSREEDICIDPSDAPALALAVLEAAGVEPVNHTVRGLGNPNWLEGIAHSLQLHIEHEAELAAAAKAEAEEMAKLEAEALEFYFAFHSAVDRPCQDWDYLDQQDKQQWLAVARKAREMRAEK